MVTCPSCHSELTDDFGLVDCPTCGAVLFIEMDGRVQVQGQEQSDPIAEDRPPDLPPALDDDLETPSEIQMDDPEPVDEVAIASDPHTFEEPPPMFEESVFEEVASDSEPIPDVPLRVSEPVIPQEAISGAMTQDLSNMASDIDSNQDSSGLRYNLIIQGIDTSDLRREVRESLLDAKFGWDVDQLLKSAQGGRMEIKSISAVKAQIVVQRLKVLPLQIRWEQYADV